MQPQRGTKERHPLSKRPLKKKLDGKTFYLDNVKKHQLTTLCEAIHALGGRVESFLHKDVTFVVTASKDNLKRDKPPPAKEGPKEKSEGRLSIKQQESCLSREKRQTGTPRPAACGSRGKALLEKAIRNNERLQPSSVLSNAESWGVKILSVEDALLYLDKLTKESSSAKQFSPVVKASTLNTPYLKIEDFNRKYKPLFTLYATFPGLCQLSRSRPIGSPVPPPWCEQWVEKVECKTREKKSRSVLRDKSEASHGLPWLICRKDTSYCECCRQSFTNLKEHLQSDLHRSFALDPSNYNIVDEVGVEIFDPDLFQPPEEALNRMQTPPPFDEICDMEFQCDPEPEFDDHDQNALDLSLNALTVGPSRDPLSPRAQLTAVSPENVQSDIQQSEFPDYQSCALSPAMPVLHIEAPISPSHHAAPCSPFDPYSLPPVLSPQVPCHASTVDPYSEPPILSPHQHTAEDTVDGAAYEMDFADIVSKLISAVTVAPSSPPFILFGDAEKVKDLESSSDLTWLESTTLSVGGSYSSFQYSPNPRKRHRSAGSEHGRRKRKRTITCGEGSSWTGTMIQPVEPQSDILVEVEGSNNITRSASVPADIGSSTSYLTPAPNQIDSFASQLLPLKSRTSLCNQDSSHYQSVFTSIEPSLIPNTAELTPSSSDSEWDCGLLSRLGPVPATSVIPSAQNHELDKELLLRPCPWMYDSSYDSHLHNILQQSNAAAKPCADEKDIAAISRSISQSAEVQ